MTEAAGLIGRLASEGPVTDDNKPNGDKEGEMKTMKRKEKKRKNNKR